MRKKVDHPQDGKSLKTFFIYAVVVLVLIALSLTWKAVLIFQQSKYTDQHFTLAVAQEDKVKEILIFNPQDSSMSVVMIKDSVIPLGALAQKTAILTDGKINITDKNYSLTDKDVPDILFDVALRYPTVKTDITIFDVLRLGFYAKNLPPNKQILEEVTSAQLSEDLQLQKTLITLFSDERVATENISVQVINATGVPGIAQRLEKVLTLQGANVVAVTTAQKKESRSQIKYYGSETYTLAKINKMLEFPVSTLANETIADIVIIIGENSKGTSKY